MKRMGVRVGGILLYVLGKLAHRMHWVWLGHYLMGSGRRREIPARYFPELRRIILCMGEEIHTCGGWYTPLHWEMDDLYNSVGKVRVRVTDTHIHILDYYIFHPSCNCFERHGRGCSCSNKKWKKVDIRTIFFHQRLRNMLSRFYRKYHKSKYFERTGGYFFNLVWGEADGYLRAEETVYCSHQGIHFCIHDSVFAGLGKPFYTTARIPL